MDANLPELDIVEDIAEVMNDEPPNMSDETETITINEEVDDSPFIRKPVKNVEKMVDIEKAVEKPGKKKKELSEKQKAHLARMREKALEKKRAKAEEKAKAMKEINEKHKAVHYVSKKDKLQEKQEEKANKKKYNDSTLQIDDTEPRQRTISNINETPDDFVPSHKEKIQKKNETKELDDRMSFLNFMGNMEKYFILKDRYEANKKKHQQKKQEIPKEKPTPVPTPAPKPAGRYSNYFN